MAATPVFFLLQLTVTSFCVHAKSLRSCPTAILWAVACQAPLSMGLSRHEYWSELPCPPSGDLPDPWMEPASPTLAGGFFITSATSEAQGFLKAQLGKYFCMFSEAQIF